MVDHTHVFWSCPSIQTFWKEVATIVSNTLGFTISATFTSLYLGYIHDGLSAYLLKFTSSRTDYLLHTTSKNWEKNSGENGVLF